MSLSWVVAVGTVKTHPELNLNFKLKVRDTVPEEMQA